MTFICTRSDLNGDIVPPGEVLAFDLLIRVRAGLKYFYDLTALLL